MAGAGAFKISTFIAIFQITVYLYSIAVMVRLASFTGSLLYVVLLQLPTNAIYSVCWLSAFSVSPVTGRVAAG